ncbi:MAG: hypothetical protein ACLFQM_06330 [Fidelibacterota bacterium]
MIELLIVIGLVIIAGFYLFNKLKTKFTKPYQGCSNCSCHCSDEDKCDL